MKQQQQHEQKLTDDDLAAILDLADWHAERIDALRAALEAADTLLVFDVARELCGLKQAKH
jgi:hypothetical protein